MPPPDNKRWTPAMDAVLHRVLENGGSYTEILNEIWDKMRVSMTRNAVAGRAHRLGIKVNTKAENYRRVKALRRIVSRSPVIVMRKRKKPKRKPTVYRGSVDIMMLEPHHCRFPMGWTGQYKYCGKTRLEGRPYCEEHAKLCSHPVHSRPIDTISDNTSGGRP